LGRRQKRIGSARYRFFRNMPGLIGLIGMTNRMPALLIIAALALLASSPHASAQGADPGWARFVGERGTTLQYPRNVFAVAAGEDVPPGPVFATRDGRARLHIFAIPNEQNESPGAFLKRMFPRDRRVLSYNRVAGNFFALSRIKEDRILYRRCNFSRGTIHCADLQYPRSEKRAWDDIVTRVSLSLRPR
jgi:hypothetical protein